MTIHGDTESHRIMDNVNHKKQNMKLHVFPQHIRVIMSDQMDLVIYFSLKKGQHLGEIDLYL